MTSADTQSDLQLTPAGHRVLAILRERGPMTPKRLGQWLWPDWAARGTRSIAHPMNAELIARRAERDGAPIYKDTGGEWGVRHEV